MSLRSGISEQVNLLEKGGFVLLALESLLDARLPSELTFDAKSIVSSLMLFLIHQFRLQDSTLPPVQLNLARLDGNDRLLDFTQKLEAACVGTVESGKMTKDLALLIHGPKVSRSQYLNTEEFIEAVAKELSNRMYVKPKL
ncbi:hypothetical protein Gohar_001091 [Gossypium harknessii]|uniref:Uncharacterized protein n=1 Tax=Gossypium harknessii TaxID=34285 RepID=A0A7J9I2S8_9ROSI|nr:hypothetical protein [Gossypium harknessii]